MPVGASLAERPADSGMSTPSGSVDGTASPVGAGAGATLGQGCFGKVTSMAWNDAPVAVKELSATALDATSIGEEISTFDLTSPCRSRTGGCQQAVYRLPMADFRKRAGDIDAAEARTKRGAAVRSVHQRVGWSTAAGAGAV